MPGEWLGAEAVGDDAEQDGQAMIAITSPAGRAVLDCEQPEDQRGQAAWAEPADEPDRRALQPAPGRHSATGTIRTTVRLSTA